MIQIVRFGPDQQLTGILAGVEGPILILPNAGLIPRAGPCRLHVELSDHLQTKGIRTFRIDVPGVGEAPRISGLSAADAIVAAMDHLAAEYGVRSFTVGGICSAADSAWRAALRDKRVTGVIMVDGICFLGPWFKVARYSRLLRRSPRQWLGILWRLANRLSSRLTSERIYQPTFEDYRDWPEHDVARAEFSELVARHSGSLWIFTGGYSDRFLDPKQFEWSFGPSTAAPEVTMSYWPDCDHLFFARSHRDRLIATIGDWMLGEGLKTGGIR